MQDRIVSAKGVDETCKGPEAEWPSCTENSKDAKVGGWSAVNQQEQGRFFTNRAIREAPEGLGVLFYIKVLSQSGTHSRS